MASKEHTRPSTPRKRGAAISTAAEGDRRQAEAESKADTISQPGGFKNDPDDATNPNEVRERHLKKLRP